jgi:pimeloyl-ACP methyl ester carboxylesterase
LSSTNAGRGSPIESPQTLEERIGDVRAVMDAAGSRLATVYGWSEGGSICLMFAATYPERTSALVLYGSYASVKDSVSPRYSSDSLPAWRPIGEKVVCSLLMRQAVATIKP